MNFFSRLWRRRKPVEIPSRPAVSELSVTLHDPPEPDGSDDERYEELSREQRRGDVNAARLRSLEWDQSLIRRKRPRVM